MRHAVRPRIAAVLFCLLYATRAHSGFDQGMQALDRWDFPRATAEFEAAAAQGDARAFAELAALALPTAGKRDSARQVAMLERGAAAGDPRSRFELAQIILRSSALYRREGVKLEGDGVRVVQLLGQACEGSQLQACAMLAELVAGDRNPHFDPPGLPAAADLAGARHWGDLWRTGRLARAEQGDRDSIVDLGLHGSRPWTGLDPATADMYSVLAAFELGSSQWAPPGASDDRARAALSRAERWEIAHGRRPRDLPPAATMAARIAAYYAYLDRMPDAERLRASAARAPAWFLAYGGVRPTENTRWPPLAPLARTVLPAVEAYHRTVDTAARARRLDTQAAIAGRLQKELSPRQLHMLLGLHERPGARKLSELHRLLSLAMDEGAVVVSRLHGDPTLAALGTDVRARVVRYAADNGIVLPSPTGEPSIAERREFYDRYIAELGGSLIGVDRIPPAEVASLSGRTWLRLLALLRREERQDLGRLLSCEPCRIVIESVRDVASARRALPEQGEAETALGDAVLRALTGAGMRRD